MVQNILFWVQKSSSPDMPSYTFLDLKSGLSLDSLVQAWASKRWVNFDLVLGDAPLNCKLGLGLGCPKPSLACSGCSCNF